MATEFQGASGVATGWHFWLPMVAPVLALVGILINIGLTTWLGRYKTHSEKTWEKRREVYTELLKRLRVLKNFADAWKTYGNSMPDDVIDGRFMGRFLEAAWEAKSYADENTLYISKKMEKILTQFWKTVEDTEDSKKKGGSVPPLKFEQERLAAGELAFTEALARAQDEIRVAG